MSGDVVQLLIESFPRILLPGLIMTIPLTLIAFAFALVIAVVVALIQYAHVPVLRQIARFYIWVIRGTPLLVQLMVGYYGPSTFGFHPNGVPVGQMEAGYCVGMSYMQIMWHVVLPQAFRTAFPALSNSLIGMVKDTSLASNITVTEMFLATRQIAGRTYQFLPLYLEVAFIYLLFSTVMTWLQRLGEKKLGTYTAKRA